MALSSRITVAVTGDLTSALDLETPTSSLSYSSQIDLTTGTGLAQADMRWSDTRTLAASGTEDLDLAGVLAGPFGTSLTFARVKALVVKAAAANTNNVNVTKNGSTGIPLFLGTTGGVPVMPGGLFVWVAPTAAGVAVTNSTADTITITNSAAGTGVTYDVIVIGASA